MSEIQLVLQHMPIDEVADAESQPSVTDSLTVNLPHAYSLDSESLQLFTRLTKEAGHVAFGDEQIAKRAERLFERIAALLREEEAQRSETIIEALRSTARSQDHPMIAALDALQASVRDRVAKYPLASAEQVAKWLGIPNSNRSRDLKERREAGTLFGLSHNNKIQYPLFQFDENGRVHPLFIELLKSVSHREPWGIYQWFTGENPDLKASPADLLQSGNGEKYLRKLSRLEVARKRGGRSW